MLYASFHAIQLSCMSNKTSSNYVNCEVLYLNEEYVDGLMNPMNKFACYQLSTNNLNYNLADHPFSKLDVNDLIFESETNGILLSIKGENIYNEITKSLLELIAMTDHKLKTKCVNISATQYRAQLVKMLCDLFVKFPKRAQAKKDFMQKIQSELMAVALHPRRMEQWIDE